MDADEGLPVGLQGQGFASLRAYYESAYRPHYLAAARATTLAVYETTLALWERLTPLVPPLPLDEIDNAWLGFFRAKLLARESSPHTVNKYLRTMNALFAKAGPEGSGNRRGAIGLLEKTPWVAEVKAPRSNPRAIPLEVLGALYRNGAAARVPRVDGIAAAEWWRGILVVASQVGIRRGAVFGITWRDVNFEQRTLTVPAILDKCGVERVKPINEVAFRHLHNLSIATLFNRCAEREDGGEIAALDQKIFPWPYRSRRMFDIEWHRLQDAAGVPAEDHYHFHDLKKTCGTQLGTVAGAFQVRSMLDHADVKTSQLYCAGDEQLREALERMPHPVEFEAVG